MRVGRDVDVEVHVDLSNRSRFKWWIDWIDAERFVVALSRGYPHGDAVAYLDVEVDVSRWGWRRQRAAARFIDRHHARRRR